MQTLASQLSSYNISFDRGLPDNNITRHWPGLPDQRSALESRLKITEDSIYGAFVPTAIRNNRKPRTEKK